jgi:hypothetical protein
MRDEDRRHPNTIVADAHPAATLLNVQALGLAAVAAASFGAGAVATAALGLVLAAVGAGLATSIAEGFPRSGTAILSFEGVTLAFVLTQLSRPAAVGVLAATGAAWFWVHRRAGGVSQIRRPVSCQ